MFVASCKTHKNGVELTRRFGFQHIFDFAIENDLDAEVFDGFDLGHEIGARKPDSRLGGDDPEPRHPARYRTSFTVPELLEPGAITTSAVVHGACFSRATVSGWRSRAATSRGAPFLRNGLPLTHLPIICYPRPCIERPIHEKALFESTGSSGQGALPLSTQKNSQQAQLANFSRNHGRKPCI